MLFQLYVKILMLVSLPPSLVEAEFIVHPHGSGKKTTHILKTSRIFKDHPFFSETTSKSFFAIRREFQKVIIFI